MCEYCHQSPHDCRCPNAIPQLIGSCDTCGDDITDAYEHYTDNYGNLFCSRECALKYHGIIETIYQGGIL